MLFIFTTLPTVLDLELDDFVLLSSNHFYVANSAIYFYTGNCYLGTAYLCLISKIAFVHSKPHNNCFLDRLWCYTINLSDYQIT